MRIAAFALLLTTSCIAESTMEGTAYLRGRIDSDNNIELSGPVKLDGTVAIMPPTHISTGAGTMATVIIAVGSALAAAFGGAQIQKHRNTRNA